MGKKKRKKEKIGLKPSLEDRYQLIIKARNFHYENFNKWMTYFYVAIGALFVGYCNLLAKEVKSDNLKDVVNYLIPFLGYIISLLWYWSSKGYYYWNINFIKLVNHYEKDLLKLPDTERVYFVFAHKEKENNYLSPVSGANISTSKIAIVFAFLITSVWGALIFYMLILNSFLSFLNWNINLLSFIIALILSSLSVIVLSRIVPKYCLKSDISKMPDLEIEFPE